MVDLDNRPTKRPVGRPLITDKNYSKLMFEEMKEANQLQAEANSISLRLLKFEKAQILINMMHEGYSELAIEKVKSKLDKV